MKEVIPISLLEPGPLAPVQGPMVQVPRAPGEMVWIDVGQWHPQSSTHRPETRVGLAHSGSGITIRFEVRDSHLLVRRSRYQDPVYKDSCVEAFLKPRDQTGYFNFELNAAGTMLLGYVEDPRRTSTGFRKYTAVPADLARAVLIRSSLPGLEDPEIHGRVDWNVTTEIPCDLFEHFVGPLGDLGGQTWRGNFHKCADESSHPHWGTWSPIGEILDFHQPERFGTLRFLP